MTPVVALSVLVLLKFMVVDLLTIYADKVIYVPVPFIFNLNYKAISNIFPMINVTTCNQWYMFTFDESTPKED